MKYILLMQFPLWAWKTEGMATWAPEDIQKNMRFLKRFNQELSEAGELVNIEGLALPEQARMVRAGKNGAPEVTDGPFPEAKEFLAGWWIIDVESPERAYDIAARASAMPGRGGVPSNIPIEVRPVMALDSVKGDDCNR